MKHKKSSQTIHNDAKLSENKSDPIEFTDIVGGIGRWQVMLLLTTLLSGLPIAWNHLGMAFLAFPVDHWCARPNGMNESLETWFADYLPNEKTEGKLQHSQCEMFALNQSTAEVDRTKTVPCNTWEFSTGYYSLIEEWHVVCSRDWMLSTSQSVYMLGFLAAVLVSGQIADLYGRHPTMMLNIVILLVAGMAAAFANSFLVFTIFRFFIAFGHAGIGLVIYVLFIETLGSQYRAYYVFLHGFGWHIGYVLLPLIAWWLKNWFYLQLFMTIPCALFFLYYWIVPESPRWLLSKGKLDKAIPILELAAKMNKKDVKDLETQAKKICFLENEEGNKASKASVLDLLRTPNLRMKTLILYFVWMTIAFTYYGLSLNTNALQGNDYLNFFLSGLMEIPATIFCMLTLDRFGRKKPFIFTLMVGGLSCFGFVFVPESAPGIKKSLAMAGKLFVSASFTIVYVYSAEIFPTVARNAGIGSSSTIARIGSAIAPFMRDLGNVTSPAVPLGIFGGLSVISALLVIKLPETNTFPVPETLEQAENFGKKT
ncbi:organic cation transporter protein-like isoform X2 [Stegodyphus dumicola]|nr:organic cation transporter protein-like isoform X2 [Stegodyphus dumicola]XP_035212351.1 organic cation transporter protein-like isoform X2 [Stegodyphus dumicola]